jgi:putative flippase GtrA
MASAARLAAAVAPKLRRFFDAAFWRSALTSAGATLSDFLTATLLVAAAAAPGPATFIGCVVGGAVAFAASRRFAFRSRAAATPEGLRFLAVWLANAALNAGLVALLARARASVSLPFAAIWLLVRGVVYAGFNYPLLRWFVFRGAKSHASDQP